MRFVSQPITTARSAPACNAQIGRETEALPPVLDIRTCRGGWRCVTGENPHQRAALYATGTTGIGGCEQLHGKELSYNNLVDLDAFCWQLVSRIRGSRRCHHQTHQPRRLRSETRLAGRGLPDGAGLRPHIGFRRRDRAESAVGWKTAGEVAKLFCRSGCGPVVFRSKL